MLLCFQNCSDPLWEKIVVVIEKNFWSLRLNAENLQIFRDHYNNLLKQWKVNTIFETWYFFKLFRSNTLEQSEFKLEKNILGFRNLQEKLEKRFVSRIVLTNVSSLNFLKFFEFFPLLIFTSFRIFPQKQLVNKLNFTLKRQNKIMDYDKKWLNDFRVN